MPDIFSSANVSGKKNNPSGGDKAAIDSRGLPVKPEDVPLTEAARRQYPHHTHSPLAAYALYPDPERLDFETRNEAEKVVLFLRQHPIVNLKWIVVSILLALAPLVLFVFPLLAFMPENFQFIAVLIWYQVVLAYVLENFLDWFFNINIVTTERVIDFDFNNLIYKRVSDAELDRIQDVTYTTGGVLRTFLNYGDVFIQTAAEVSEFDFLAVPNPDRVAQIINELREAKEKEGEGLG
jgi:membrane protein YdbS with pleckstrin-like domain